ncbi:MAG: hypothetical protein RBS68_06405 [Anaerolineales bacterium]|jgi:hypothetical protein|nr:hypothetical protein [Anaerolineales bacterium]
MPFFLTSLDGLFWLALTLTVLAYLQRIMHREIQTVFLILTRHPGITVGVFALIFMPGVFLHELSHFVMARVLGVHTGSFSLIPRPMPDGRLQMGYVETERSDFVRDSLVGAAPILFGTLFLAWVAVEQLGLAVMWDALRANRLDAFLMGLSILPRLPDFWLWFYLLFAVSSTMMPSDSDRQAWTAPLVVVAIFLALLLLVGAGPWMLVNLAPPLNEFLRGTALVLLVSVVIHLSLIAPFLLLHRILVRLTGLDVG